MNRFEIALGKRPSKIRKAIAKVTAQIKKEKKPRRRRLTRRARESVIAQVLSTSEGRTTLAQSMMQPLRQRMDYAGIARRAFSVEPLPTGALPIYVPDSNEEQQQSNINSFVVGEDEPNPMQGITGIQGRHMTIPLFDVVSYPTISLRDVRARRFNLVGDEHSELLKKSKRGNVSGGTIG